MGIWISTPYICGKQPSMRVGQLARKLNVMPADILAALPSGSVPSISAYNTRLTPEQIQEVVRFFRPSDWKEVLKELESLPPSDAQENDLVVVHHPVTDPLPVETDVEVKELPGASEPQPETPQEIIRAPRIALPGLRIVGKIELPEKRKEEKPRNTADGEPRKMERIVHQKKERRKDSPNPVALAREQARREMEKKRREEERLRKQLKTQRYLEKIASRKQRLAESRKNKVKKVTASEGSEPSYSIPSKSLSLWQRMKRWLFRET